MNMTPDLQALIELSAKATPGPWQVTNATDVFTELGGARADGLTADDNDGWQVADFPVGVCFVGSEEYSLSHAEQKANAKLSTALVNWFRETHKGKKG